MALLLGLALLFGSGCSDEDGDDVTVGDDDVSAYNTPDTGDDDSSLDEGTIPPTPSPTPQPNPLTVVTVWPAYMKIDTTSTFTYSAKGTLKSGEEVNVTVDQWTSTNPGAATVDDHGNVTPVGPGTTFIAAIVGDVTSQQVQLEVVGTGILSVKVVDADTRQPIAGADVYRGMDGTDTVTTDANGEATFTGTFSGAQTVTAHAESYHYATVADAISRQIEIPIRSLASAVQGSFSGDVDFSAMGEVGLREIRVGLITRSFSGNPLSLDTNTIIGKYRKVEVCGTTTSLPSNIVGEVSSCETDPALLKYAVPGPSGTYDSYLLAGDLNLNDVLTWLTDPEIFTNLGKLLLSINNMYEFSFDLGQDIVIQAPNDTAGVPVAPDGKTSSPLTVDVPLLPNGISVDYPPVAFAIADMGERGNLPVGLAGATAGTKVPIFHPPMTGILQDRPLTALIMACDQGVGHDGAYVAVSGREEVSGETVKTPPFMDLILKKDYDLAARTFSFLPVADATLYRSIFSWQLKQDGVTTEVIWDVYQPPAETTVTLPSIPGTPEMIDVDWEFFAYDNGEKYPFEVFTSGQDVDVYDSSLILQRISRNKLYNLPEE
jgi:hypothetical protein